MIGKQPKNVALAFVLATLLPLLTLMGMGHFYVGTLWRGLTLLVLGWVLTFLWLLFLIASVAVVGKTNAIIFLALDFLVLVTYIGLWVWQAEDVRRTCLQRNSWLEAPGPAYQEPQQQEPLSEAD